MARDFPGIVCRIAFGLALPAALLAACHTSSSFTVSGTVTAAGEPFAGAIVNSGATSATTDASGAFSLTAGAAGSRAAIKTTAAGFAPQISVIKLKEGVSRYSLPIALTTLSDELIPTASIGKTVNTTAYGNPVSIVLAPGAISNSGAAHLRFATFDAKSGPGTMESVPTGGQTALQSGGMFYVEVVDDNGQPLTVAPGGLKIQLSDNLPPSVSGAGTLAGWSLNPDGVWDSPVSLGDPAIPVNGFGYWNSDRNYQTACVIGHLASSGAQCSGNQVRADGPDGISSFDNSGGDGTFCVEGAQTWMSTIVVGSSSAHVQMPASAGSCSVPSSCKDIGTVNVSSKDCQAADGGTDGGGGPGCGEGTWTVSCSYPAISTCHAGTGTETLTVTSSGTVTDTGGLSWSFNSSTCTASTSSSPGCGQNDTVDFATGAVRFNWYCDDGTCPGSAGTCTVTRQ